MVHPKLIEITNKLAVFKSHFSTKTIFGGRHEKIQAEKTILSQSFNHLGSSAVATVQKMFKIKTPDARLKLGDGMEDYGLWIMDYG